MESQDNKPEQEVEYTDEQIKEMADESGIKFDDLKTGIFVTKTLKQVQTSITMIELALDNIMKILPNKQVQFMLQDTHSIRSHIGSFFLKGPLEPHKEVPLEKSELTMDDVDNAFDQAAGVEEVETEVQTELNLVE